MSRMTWKEGVKYRRRFSGLRWRDLAISSSRLAPASPRCVSALWRSSCRSHPVPGPPVAVAGDEQRSAGTALDQPGQQPRGARVPVHELVYVLGAAGVAAAGAGLGTLGVYRGCRVGWGTAFHPGRDRRSVVSVAAAPRQPGRDAGATGVPGVDRRLAPESFEGFADLVVGDVGQPPGLAEADGGLVDGDGLGAAGVRRADRVEEGVAGGADGDRGRHDGGPACSLATDNGAASRTGGAVSPRAGSHGATDDRVLSAAGSTGGFGGPSAGQLAMRSAWVESVADIGFVI